MDCTILSTSLQASKADTFILGVYQGEPLPADVAAQLDPALAGTLTTLLSRAELEGKLAEVTVIYPPAQSNPLRLLVVGLGKRAELSPETVRKAAAAAIKKASQLKANQVASALYGADNGALAPAIAAQAIFEGSLLALYQFNRYKSSADSRHNISGFALVCSEGVRTATAGGLRRAQAIAAGVTLTRDLVNLPPAVATPTHIAAAAAEIAGAHGLKLLIGDQSWAKQHKMGAFLGVAQGAQEPARFIVLELNSERTDLDTVVLVGKGITFDSGGISIKPAEHMENMKSDMAGAAAVLGAIKAAALLDLPLHVVAIAPCTENMPDGAAYHPADILTASNGKTIEIISTDAEGRLILADALVYAANYHPKAVIDLATLTGACVIALGDNMAAGMFSDDDALVAQLDASGRATQERVWHMPMWEDYRAKIKSDVADMKNSGGRFSGVGSAAIFLKEFTSYPWVHLDIAPMALTDSADGYLTKGATGYGVRLLVEFLSNWK